MAIRSSDTRYGTVAIALHWTVALAILVLLVLGFRAAGTEDDALKAGLLRTHVLLGIFTLLLTAIRVVWWVFADRKPAPLEGTPAWQQHMARVVHFLFYVVIIAMVISGVGMVTLSGAFSILFGDSHKALPDFWTTRPRAVHGLGAFLLCLMITVHMIAALFHQKTRSGRFLYRMGIGRTPIRQRP